MTLSIRKVFRKDFNDLKKDNLSFTNDQIYYNIPEFKKSMESYDIISWIYQRTQYYDCSCGNLFKHMYINSIICNKLQPKNLVIPWILSDSITYNRYCSSYLFIWIIDKSSLLFILRFSNFRKIIFIFHRKWTFILIKYMQYIKILKNI